MKKSEVFYITSVLIVGRGYSAPLYYVTTNAAVSVYIGYTNLPEMVKEWLTENATEDKTLPIISTDRASITLVAPVVVR